ncbi:MAG: glycosyltransferase [Gammaproteobacteria bacterium]
MAAFTVVIPTFNRAHIISRALGSVLQQTYKDFEIIVVDDGSLDRTAEVVHSFSDARIQYISIEASGGPATPRNEGIRRAQGEWIAFLDSDDYWLPEKLDVIAEVIHHQPVDFVSHYQAVVNSAGATIGVMGPRLDAKLTYGGLLCTENTLATSSVAVRRAFLERNELFFSEEYQYRAIEDFDLWLRILRSGANSFVVPRVLGQNISDEEHIGTNNLFFQNMHRLLSDHSDWLEGQDKRQKRLSRSRLFANLYIRRGMELLREGRFFAGIGMAMSGFKVSPLQGVNYFALRLRQRLMLPGYRHFSR